MKNDDSKWVFVRLHEPAFFWVSLTIAAMGLSISTAFAKNSALQFVVEDFNGSVWNFRDGRSMLLSEHTATNGWSLALKDGDMICFDSTTSPLAFPDSATGRVTRAFAVAACEEAADHATLFDASCSVRFMPSFFSRGGTSFLRIPAHQRRGNVHQRHVHGSFPTRFGSSGDRGGIRAALSVERDLRRRGTRHRRLGAELARGRRRADPAFRNAD